jgi:hypothetical protein
LSRLSEKESSYTQRDRGQLTSINTRYLAIETDLLGRCRKLASLCVGFLSRHDELESCSGSDEFKVELNEEVVMARGGD